METDSLTVSDSLINAPVYSLFFGSGLDHVHCALR